jgi:hypothetical protein
LRWPNLSLKSLTRASSGKSARDYPFHDLRS